jgi:hypothetical protein
MARAVQIDIIQNFIVKMKAKPSKLLAKHYYNELFKKGCFHGVLVPINELSSRHKLKKWSLPN